MEDSKVINFLPKPNINYDKLNLLNNKKKYMQIYMK